MGAPNYRESVLKYLGINKVVDSLEIGSCCDSTTVRSMFVDVWRSDAKYRDGHNKLQRVSGEILEDK